MQPEVPTDSGFGELEEFACSRSALAAPKPFFFRRLEKGDVKLPCQADPTTVYPSIYPAQYLRILDISGSSETAPQRFSDFYRDDVSITRSA